MIRVESGNAVHKVPVEQLEAFLMRLETTREDSNRFGAVVFRDNGDSIAIVLGDCNASVLTFIGDSGDPPYYTSLGDPEAIGGFDFFMNGHYSEFESIHVIESKIARQAVVDFVQLESGLPDNVRWIEV